MDAVSPRRAEPASAPAGAWAILNPRAGAGSGLEASLRRAFGERLRVTASIDAGRAAVHEAIDAGCTSLWACGGDGTFLAAVAAARAVAGERAPPIGLVALGTGNAVAGWLGATGDLASSFQASPSRIALIEVCTDGRAPALSPLVGLGLHGAVTHDFATLRRLGIGGHAGWTLAALGLTTPRALARRRPVFRVTAGEDGAIEVDPAGAEIAHHPAGSTLHEGPASVVDASTCPIIGFGQRIFPHAEQVEGRAHLRVLGFGAMRWLGTWSDAREGRLAAGQARSFLVRSATISGPPTPLGLAGDPAGRTERVELRVVPGIAVMRRPR